MSQHGARAKELPSRAARVRDAVVPDWLREAARPRPAPVPWPLMIRAALAICVPLAAAVRGVQAVLW